jgi:hypothetical protein
MGNLAFRGKAQANKGIAKAATRPLLLKSGNQQAVLGKDALSN